MEKGEVLSPERHFVFVKTLSGRRSKVAYEDIRLCHRSDLTGEVMETTLEHAISEADITSAEPSNRHPAIANRDDMRSDTSSEINLS